MRPCCAPRRALLCLEPGEVVVDTHATNESKTAIEDADHSLRVSSRLFPDALTPFVTCFGKSVARVEWIETQIARRQRRLDRVLLVRLNDGESRWLHVEWTDRLTRRVQERLAEYHWNLAVVGFHDARVRRRQGDKDAKPVPIETILVVLFGRKKPWPRFGVYRTSPRRKKFCGVKFRIEAVYQKSVAELEAMGSLFWLVFVPLARDVDQEKLRRIIDKLCEETNDYEFAELAATMVSMAKLKKDVPAMADMVISLVKEKTTVRSFEVMRTDEVKRREEQARQEGTLQGITQGIEQGITQGIEQGITQGIEPLVYIFERRLGRLLTAKERRRLAIRTRKQGPSEVGDVVLDYSPKKLAKWLAPRKPAKPTTA